MLSMHIADSGLLILRKKIVLYMCVFSLYFVIWFFAAIRLYFFLQWCDWIWELWQQPPRSTRSSSLVTFARPSTLSSLRITDRSFQYASPRLWNQLPASLRQPRTNLFNSASPSSLSGTSSISSIDSPLSSSIRPSPLHSFTPGLKPFFSANPPIVAYLFSFPTDSMDSPDCLPILLSISVFLLFSLPILHFLVVVSLL